MIFSSHKLNYKIARITVLKEENEELKTKYTQIHSKLMKIQLESELVFQFKKDSLYSLDKNPFKIIVSKKHDN